jgi:recombinational DNA repair ATPase RecF
MYIRKASLRNVRSISEMEWVVQEGEEAGWHVILGDNGSGKSSFLRALALGLVGPRNAEALRLDWNQWITRGADSASIQLQVGWDTLDQFSGSGNVGKTRSLAVGLELRREETSLVQWHASAKLVTLDVSVLGTGNPWLDTFGRSADDPDFEEFVEEMQRARAAELSGLLFED